MAEGLLGGLLGGEEEGAEAEAAAEALVGAEAFAAAVAADQAKHDPAVAEATTDFLREQTHLLKVQAKHLQDEHELRLQHLRGQSREGKLRRVGQRLRIGMQVVTAVIVTAVGVGVCAMVLDALSSRRVVVDPFDAPPALAARGFSGKVVASGLLDALQQLQQATRTSDKVRSQSAWGSDIKFELPETGVSIAEIDRLLHERLGHDLHVEGDLVQTDQGGIALTVRGDGFPAKTFRGGAADLDPLTAEAAEYVYGRSQPVEYATYLSQTGRSADSLAFLPGAYARATTDQRVTLALYWGGAYLNTDPLQAIQKYRSAMALAPVRSREWWSVWNNLVAATILARGEEAAWRESQAFLRSADEAPERDRPSPSQYDNAAQITWDVPLNLAGSLFHARLAGGAGTLKAIIGPGIADDYALLHDPAQAARYLASSDPEDPATIAEGRLLQAEAALDAGDAAAAIPPMEAFWAAWQKAPLLETTYYDNPSCYLGLAYGLAGRLADAEALLKRAGPWSRCYAFHGDVLVHAGDVAGAQRVWAEGLNIAPDPPMIYLHRGTFELGQGALKAAEADLSTAHAKAPHFADPLKAWGDLLAREGRWQAALAKYDEALKYAPAWAALHQARDAAARHRS